MGSRRGIRIVLAAALSFVIFFSKALAYLHQRHPHEDAFILFRYAEHLAHGQGIVFNTGGPRTEGATDFLYLLLLALLVRIGFDVAVAASCLNACGAGLIAALLASLWLKHREPAVPKTGSRSPLSHALVLFVAWLVPFLPSAQASYDGFGTELYAALVLLGFYWYVSGTSRAIATLPYLCLALGLFRPDGAIVGAGFYTLALAQARTRALRTRVLLHGALCLAAGLCYFLWRWRYFGELLPLPLYVKSRSASPLPGLADNVAWFSDLAGPVPILLIAAALSLALSRRQSPDWRRIAFGTAPAWLLLLALTFANQLQNVDWRFQAPSYTVFVGALFALGADCAERNSAAAAPWLVCAACTLGLLPGLARGKKLWPATYVDTFAVDLGKILDHQVVVLTEAGRLAYWTNARVEDMVGLNSPTTAKTPPSVAYVDWLAPQIVMFHAAGTLDVDRLVPGDQRQEQVVRISSRALAVAVRAPFRRYLENPRSAYGAGDLPTKLAPVVLSAYLAERDDFDVFLVRYGGDLNHVIAIKKGQPFSEPVAAALRRAQMPGRYLSYARSKGF